MRQSGRWRRFRGGVEKNLYALPRPYLAGFFEGARVGISLGFGTRGLSDDVLSAWLEVDLPAPLADALDWLLPDRRKPRSTPPKGWARRR